MSMYCIFILCYLFFNLNHNACNIIESTRINNSKNIDNIVKINNEKSSQITLSNSKSDLSYYLMNSLNSNGMNNLNFNMNIHFPSIFYTKIAQNSDIFNNFNLNTDNINNKYISNQDKGKYFLKEENIVSYNEITTFAEVEAIKNDEDNMDYINNNKSNEDEDDLKNETKTLHFGNQDIIIKTNKRCIPECYVNCKAQFTDFVQFKYCLINLCFCEITEKTSDKILHESNKLEESEERIELFIKPDINTKSNIITLKEKGHKKYEGKNTLIFITVTILKLICGVVLLFLLFLGTFKLFEMYYSNHSVNHYNTGIKANIPNSNNANNLNNELSSEYIINSQIKNEVSNAKGEYNKIE